MVLVDSSHPDQLAPFAEVGVKKEIPKKQIRSLIWFLSHLGTPGRFKDPRYFLLSEVYDRTQAFLPESGMAWFDERLEAPNTLRQAGQYNSLGDIPLVVPAFTRPSKPVDGNDLRNTWLELQQELTLLSENSKIKMLGESRHYIQFDQPEEVIEAIRAVVQQCLSIQTP